MQYKYVVLEDQNPDVEETFKEFVSALKFAKTLSKPLIYEFSKPEGETSDTTNWECVWNWKDDWDEDTAVNLVLNREYKEVANDADQIDDNHASDAFKDMLEDFELKIRKTPDDVEISTSGDEAGEVFDFARAILGDNFEAFDQDFPMPVDHEETELEPAEFDYDFDEDQISDPGDVSAEDAFSDIEFRDPGFTDAPVENTEVTEKDLAEPSDEDPDAPSETVEPTEKDVVEPSEIVPAAEKALMDTIEQTPANEAPKDMIDGKLVDAKNPTESEVEVEEDEEDDEEDVDEGLLGAAALGGLAAGAASAIGNKILNSSLEEDAVEEDYTGTPEIRTTHLEYTDDDVTDGKAVLPDNITKTEDDHCKKANKGINHDADPAEKALLKEATEIKVWDCIWDDDVIGQVEAATADEAYEKMEATWPELPYGTGDGIAYVEEADPEDLTEESDHDKLIQWIRDHRKAHSVEKDLDEDEFLEAFGQELVKNNIKPKKCKGSECTNECGDNCKRDDADELAELFNLDLNANVNGGDGNKVGVMNTGGFDLGKVSEALVDSEDWLDDEDWDVPVDDKSDDEELDEIFDAKINLGVDGGTNNNVDVLSSGIDNKSNTPPTIK